MKNNNSLNGNNVKVEEYVETENEERKVKENEKRKSERRRKSRCGR